MGEKNKELIDSVRSPGQIIAPKQPKTVKLDIIDRRIIYVLLVNSRLSATKIAKLLGIPKEKVMYRINRLVEEKVIVEFYTAINTTRLGYDLFMLNISLKNTSQQELKNLVVEMQKMHYVNWVMTSFGSWDLMTMIQAKGLGHLDKILDEVFTCIGSKLRDYSIFSIVDFQHTTPRYLTLDIKMPQIKLIGKRDFSYFKELEERNAKEASQKISLDNIDVELLNSIASNSRKSLKEIGEEIGISSDAANYRLRKLIMQDLITGFKVRLNHYLFGYQFQFVFVKIPYMSDDKKKQFVYFCKNHHLINAVFKLIGQWNFAFEVFSKDVMELKMFEAELTELFGDIIQNITLSLEFNQYKFTYLGEGIYTDLKKSV
ncbi:Lrp/AsnC family transcriptional regulator [Candidatus Woesearchaeota archaeon]|nr:Lrp/AsnC family transcriptional regulator [Candidatus Woesearchaeota archaeon]